MKSNLKVSYSIGILSLVSVCLFPHFLNAETCPLTVGKPYKTRYSSSVYYVSSDCAKRPIKDPETYFSYFSSWAEVKVVSAAVLSSVKDHDLGFLPWGPKKVFLEGSIIKSPTEDSVYIVLHQKLYAFDTEQTFLYTGYKWEWVEDVAPEVIAQYSRGDDFTATNIPDGMLLKFENSPKVYYFYTTDRGIDIKHIESLTELRNLGYRSDRIAIVPTYGYSPSESSTSEDVQRDQKRLSDIKQIQTALELYYTDHNTYPVATVELGKDAKCLNDTGFVSSETFSGGCTNPYMGIVPKGPGVNEYYHYVASASGQTYTITATLETGAGGFGSGPIIASPSGITYQ